MNSDSQAKVEMKIAMESSQSLVSTLPSRRRMKIGSWCAILSMLVQW
jgi:hypothetical protein